MRRLIAAALILLAAAAPVRAATLIRDAEIEQTLRRLSAPLFQAAGIPGSTVNIYIIQDRSLNAFVAGGRNIFLYTGLLMELETPEELLGVIAHEIGHLSGGHQAVRAAQLRDAQGAAILGLLIGIGVGIAGGGDAGLGTAAGIQGAIVRSILANSRAQEAAADQAALSYLDRAGISPKGLQDVIGMFRGQEVLNIGSMDPYVVTHPLSTDRMSLIDRRVEEAAGRSFKPDPEREYWHGRLRAKLEGFLVPDRVLASVAGKPDDEMTLIRKAAAYHRRHDEARALAAADALIALRPGDAFYQELKGQILLESNRALEAIPYYRRAVQIEPGIPLLKAGLGRALLQPDQPKLNAEALSVLKEARAADLADISALWHLSQAYARAGDTGMATLTSAEHDALTGRVETAVVLARRAAAILPNGSPGWLRAQDILRLDKSND